MKQVILKIDGMSCSACQATLEKYLNRQDGVNASVNLVMQEALIQYDEDKLTISDLETYIQEAGYKSLGIKKDEEISKKKNNYFFYLITILFIFYLYITMSHMLNLPMLSFLKMDSYPNIYGIISFVLSLPFLVYGFDLFKSGVLKIIHKSPNMDTLVTIGVGTSFFYSVINLVLLILGNNTLVHHLYFESVVMIIYFVKLGRWIDSKSKKKTVEAIQELVQMTPKTALLKDKKEEKEIMLDEIKKGSVLIAKPGMKFAVDGEIIKGSSYIEESFITGESEPIKKQPGDLVVAGSVNLNGYIEYKALKIGPDSTISEIVRLVQEAVNKKSSMTRIADRVSLIFVPIIIILAIVTGIIYLLFGNSFEVSMIHMVNVLLVACPCALGLATPLATIISSGTCARRGILIKSSEIFESISKINAIVFDKTGTLTYGELRISRLANYSNYANDKLLNIVASLEKKSNHPIASAFKIYQSKYEVLDFQEQAGVGISGKIGRKTFFVGNKKNFEELNITNLYQGVEDNFLNLGNSVLYILENNEIIGLIGIKDIIRKNSKKTIEVLKSKVEKVIMLSGDQEKTAKRISSSLGIEEVIAPLLPSEKAKYLEKLQKEGFSLMMVGDGINDAPALANALVGISMNSGMDIAMNSANVILLNNDITKIVDLINQSQKTVRIIKQNLFFAFIYNLLMIPIAMGGLQFLHIEITPIIASIAMTLSSLTVVFNSLRLAKTRERKKEKKNLKI